MEVRRASEASLDPLVAVLGQRHFFTDRLARQQDGRGVLLVAWLDGRPVGDVFLDHGPADEPEVRRHLPDLAACSAWSRQTVTVKNDAAWSRRQR